MMLMPGISSPRVPARIRLFIAIAVTLALAPMLLHDTPLLATDLLTMTRTVLAELAIGGLIGLMGRLFFLALETFAMSAAMNIGLGNPFGAPIDEGEPLPPIANLITLAATCLIFITNLHWEIIRGLVASYSVIPLGADFSSRYALNQTADILTRSFLLSLRICSPFIIYAIFVNFAIGVLNRLTPNIPIFFISGPFIITGRLFLLYAVFGPMVQAFLQDFPFG